MLAHARAATRAGQPPQRFADSPDARGVVSAAPDHAPFVVLERSCLLHAN
jgi:hypothetical protein